MLLGDIFGDVLVHVEDDVRTAQPQERSDQHQFRIVEMVDVGVLFDGGSVDRPHRLCHAFKPVARLVHIGEAHAVITRERKTAWSDQDDIVSGVRQRFAFSISNAWVVGAMYGCKMHDFHVTRNPMKRKVRPLKQACHGFFITRMGQSDMTMRPFKMT